MKRLLLLLLLLIAATAFAQNAGNGPVTKKTSGAAINTINEDLTFGTGRTLTIASGGTLTVASGATLNGVQRVDADLTALAALASTGFAARTASDTWVTRAIIGTAGEIAVSNGDGIAGAPTLSLIATGVTAGTYGSATQSLTGTVDAKGRLTALSAQTVTPAWSSITSKPTTLSGYGITDAATSSALTTHTGRTDNPHTVTKAQVGLGNVTNDAQTKASVVPNTPPTAGQILVGNSQGSYEPTDTDQLQIQLRQGTDSERQTIIPGQGEPIWTTDTEELFVGNGTTLGGRKVSVSSNLVISYTGALRTALVLTMQPENVLVPSTQASGAVTYSSIPGPTISTFAYGEGGYGNGDTGGPRLTSLTFFNLIGVVNSLSPGALPLLTTLSFPELVTVGADYSPNGMPALTTWTHPKLVAIGGSMNASTLASLTTLSFPELLSIKTDCNPQQMASLTTLSFPKMVSTGGSFQPMTMAALTTLSIPVLVRTGSSFGPNGMASLTTLSGPELVTVGGPFQPGSMAALTTLSFPKLMYSAGISISSMASLTAISLPEFVSASGTVAINSMPALTTISLPNLVSTAGYIYGNSSNGNITTVDLSALKTLGTGTIISFAGQKLTQASVDHILARVALMDGTNGTMVFGTGKTLVLNGGTNATPSATGLANKAIIVARGATVNTN
ncbi:MAG: hypothetical protein WC378_13940 [Opitutaceae bacterium]|jgi:hypothetical protein